MKIHLSGNGVNQDFGRAFSFSLGCAVRLGPSKWHRDNDPFRPTHIRLIDTCGEDRRTRNLRIPGYGVLAQSRALAKVWGPHQTPISMWSMELKACCAVTLSPNLKATHARRLALRLEGP